MTINSQKEIDTTLLDKFKETGDKNYLDQWYASDDAIVLAMRLSNYTVTRDRYKSIIDYYKGTPEYAGKVNMVNPDVLSYAYEAIGVLLYSWDPERSKFTTYVYNYGPSRVVRLKERVEAIDREVTVVDYEELSLYEDIQELFDVYGQERAQAIGKINEIRELIIREGDNTMMVVFDEMSGKISPKEASEMIGVQEQSLTYYRRQVREFITERVGGV